MVATSTKQTAAKKGRSPAKERRTQARAQNAQASLVSSASNSPSKVETPRTARYSHRLPTDEQRRANGRVAGRNLIRWSRPRMTEKLMLHLHYECNRHKIPLPWDAIAHRLHPGSSGAAVVQHINRLRRELVAEGHMVPPLTQKSASNIDPDIRGYVRQNVDGDDFETTRPVTFDEDIDDPKFNLPGEFNIPEEEFIEPMMDIKSPPSVGSEPEYRCPDSPTPMGRNSSKSSHGSEESFGSLPPQFVSPIEVVVDTRRLSAAQLQHLNHGSYDMKPNHCYDSGHSPLGSEAGTSSIEITASPNQSFETNEPKAELIGRGQQHVPFPNAHGYSNDYRTATLHGWAHPYMYQMGIAQNMHSSTHGLESSDRIIASFPAQMHMGMAHQCNPYMELDPSAIRQTHGHVGSMLAERKQIEPSTYPGARMGNPFTGFTDPSLTKAEHSTSL